MRMESGDCVIGGCPIEWAAASDAGRERAENEDRFLVEAEVGLFLVSDGMGGHRGGAVASEIVAQDLPVMIENRLHRLRKGTVRSIRSILKSTIMEQNRQLQMEADSESGYKGMGTTVVVTLIRGARVYAANLGDSRMYRFFGGKLRQMTKDHSVISELIDKGKIEPEEAENHAAQGEITHYVGMEEKATAFVRSFAARKGERYLLCTDGLTDMVDDKRICEILCAEQSPTSCCEKLIQEANSAGGVDNITVVLIDYATSN